jgi:hypothetical protein
MALVQRDFILRLIEAVGAAIAAALRRRRDGDLAGAHDELTAAVRNVLGTVGPVVLHADARTAIDLLSDPRRVVLWIRLLSEDADVLAGLGRAADSLAAGSRARSLAHELRERNLEMSDDDRAFVGEVLQRPQ